MESKTLFSSASVEWATPQDFFEKLDKEFNFDLDPCATHENHKCEKYFTQEEDGLSQNWGGAIKFFATHHTGGKSGNGSKRLFMKPKRKKLLLFC